MSVPAALALLLHTTYYGFEPPRVTVTPDDGGGVLVSITIEHRGGQAAPSRPVPFTYEPWVLAVEGTVARERNLFGSGLALDLDGDGKTTTSIPFSCDGPVAVVGAGQRLEPFEPDGMEYGPGRVMRIGARGAFAVLYTPCNDEPIVGLSPRPMKIHTHPGPFVMINVVEKVAGPKAKAKLRVEAITLDGEPVDAGRHRTRSFEPFDGPRRKWGAVQSVLVTLPRPASRHVVTLKVVGAGKGMVAATVELSPRRSVRVRTPPGTAKLR